LQLRRLLRNPEIWVYFTPLLTIFYLRDFCDKINNFLRLIQNRTNKAIKTELTKNAVFPPVNLIAKSKSQWIEIPKNIP
jgi:hypothetical protein